MSKEMKLIMENWRNSVLFEQQENPETVEDLLKGLNAYILSKSDKVKRVAASIARALSNSGDIADETILEINKFLKLSSEASFFAKSIMKSLPSSLIVSYIPFSAIL